MNKLTIIRNLFAQIVDDIDAGNSNIDEDQYDEILEQIKFFSNSGSKYSKYQSAKYLGISRATFDNHIKNGWIPEGRRQQGFKEKY